MSKDHQRKKEKGQRSREVGEERRRSYSFWTSTVRGLIFGNYYGETGVLDQSEK